MQTLLRHADWRLLYALTQGLHARPAQSGVFRGVGAAKRAGASGPNRVMTSMSVKAAKCAGPLSFVTRSSLTV